MTRLRSYRSGSEIKSNQSKIIISSHGEAPNFSQLKNTACVVKDSIINEIDENQITKDSMIFTKSSWSIIEMNQINQIPSKETQLNIV